MTAPPAFASLTLTRTGRVLTIALDRPKHNAVDRAMHEALEQAFRWVATDESTGAVVLTGVGSAFSVGGDIDGMREEGLTGIGNSADSLILQGAPALFRSLLELPQPIVAALNGHAIGVAATLALLCDIVIAAPTARIGDPHVRVGLAAGDGGAVIWPLLIGPQRAKRYLLTGHLLTAAEAERIGLIGEVVEAAALLDRAMSLATEMAELPEQAVRLTKQLINDVVRQQADRTLVQGAVFEDLTSRSPAHDAAIEAFLASRGGTPVRRED